MRGNTLSGTSGCEAGVGNALATQSAANLPDIDDAIEALEHQMMGSRAMPWPKSVSALNVLVCDEHYKHSLGIVRNLGRRGVNVDVLATSEDSLACRSRYRRRVVLSGSADIPGLIETALRAVKSERVDLVIPVSYSMTLAMARRKAEFLNYTRIELADSNAIER